jgi:hypothetical protein
MPPSLPGGRKLHCTGSEVEEERESNLAIARTADCCVIQCCSVLCSEVLPMSRVL